MARKVIGPTGSRRRRWFFLCATAAAIAAAVLFIPGAFAIVSGSPSNFESNDGNMTVETAGHADWNCFANGKSSGFASGITVGASCPTGANALNYGDASASPADGAGEIQLVSGSKFDDICPGLNVGNNPPKDEFQATAEYSDTNSTTHDTYFYGASIRPTTNGNSTGNLELNQVAGNGTTQHGCRTAGDRLIAFDFLNGGTSLQFHVLTYITPANTTAGGNSGSCYSGKSVKPPCWGAQIITPDSTEFEGEVNTGLNGVTGAIDAAHNGISGTAINAFAFNEMGVNLTQVLGLQGQCFSFPQQVWETRSSGSSFTSNPQDLEFQSITINNCGEIKIIKQSDPRGNNQAFSFTSSSNQLPASSTAGGVICSGNTTAGVQADGSFCLNDTGNAGKTLGSTAAADNSTGNTIDEQNVPQGTYTVSEGTEPGGYSVENLSCTTDTTSGSSAITSSGTATITLKPTGVVTCLYEDKQNSATLKTHVSSTAVFPGTNVTDTATVTGSNTSENPSSPPNVTFYLCSGTTTGCTSTSNSIGTAALGNGSGGVSTATSPAVNTSAHPLAAGNYCFGASWAGDSNYPGTLTDTGTSATNLECFTVSQISTTVVTTPSVGQNGSTTFGDTNVSDSATITAGQAGGGAITGTVTFFLCDPTQVVSNACASGGHSAGSTTTLVDQGTTTPSAVAVSPAFSNSGNGVNQTGTWCWRAVYDPGTNTNYTGNSDASSTECFTVTDTFSNASTQTWLPNDSATVTAAHGAPLNGTLSIQLYSGLTCAAGSQLAVSASKQLTNATSSTARTVATSNTGFTVGATGDYSWLVTFTSTDSNVTGLTHCEKSSLTITN